MISLIPKKFISRALDFKNEGAKNKWVSDLLDYLNQNVDTTNAIITALNQAFASAGVLTWNSRSGIVTPQSGDYDFSQIAGAINGDQLPGMSVTKRGGVPPTGTPSGKFLKDDGTFAVVAAGVTSFNTRTGAVVSVLGDYDFSQISGTIDGAQLPAMSATKKGGVPATGTPSGLFLRDDATFASPGGGVASFNTRTGAVVSATNDYTWAQVNKATSNIADITTKDHTSLTSIGTNTHAQIDTALAAAATQNYALIMEYFF